MATKKMNVLWILLLSMLVLANIPYSNAALSGSAYVTEITSLPFNPKVVDVDSAGRIFVGDQANDVWRSIDNGVSWTKVIDGAASAINIGFVYVNSLNYVFTTVWQSATNHSIYRSIDNGASWSIVQASSYAAWNIAEMSNGTMFYNTLTTCMIYKSDNAQGSSWSEFYNGSSLGVEHFHWVYVSSQNQIYLTTGDGQYDATIKRYNAGSWQEIANDTKALLYYQTVAMTSDSTYMYFFGDGASRNYRMPHAGTTTANFEWIMDTQQYQASATNFAYDAVRIGEVYLFGTDDGEVWGSWDGLHWAKIFDSGSGGWIYRFSRRTPIYFVDAQTNKLYRLNIQKEDLISLYYQTYNSIRGTLINADTYVLEQRLTNGLNYLDFSDVALINVQATIKGLSRYNEVLAPAHVENAGFEWGNTTGWTVNSGAGTFGVATVTNTDKANGTYSLRYVKGAGDSTDALFYEPYATAYTTINRGDVWLVSAYVKANVSSIDRVRIVIANASASFQTLSQDTFDVSTSWQRIKFYYMPKRTTPTLPINICASFRVIKGIDITVYWDSILIQKLEAGIAYNNGQTNDEIHKWELPFSYFTTTLNTVNPSLNIAGQVVSYTGTLTNGSTSTPTILAGIITGTLQVTASLSGSQQVILTIVGTKSTSMGVPYASASIVISHFNTSITILGLAAFILIGSILIGAMAKFGTLDMAALVTFIAVTAIIAVCLIVVNLTFVSLF